MKSQKNKKNRKTSFNGAALFRARKYHYQYIGLIHWSQASMGPRFLGRGNSLFFGLFSRLIMCFNGAALFRARKYIDAIDATTETTLASMGPRFLGRGNSHKFYSMASNPRCFNGAALFRARKLDEYTDKKTGENKLQWGRAF